MALTSARMFELHAMYLVARVRKSDRVSATVDISVSTLIRSIQSGVAVSLLIAQGKMNQKMNQNFGSFACDYA